MSTIFRRSISCFFCHSPCPGQKDHRSFRCLVCGCLNRYDEAGGIVSDEPAMYIESLNQTSFAKRASASQTQLPTAYGKGPFCQTCQSNQLILINLLSNYLPAPTDPEYSARLEMLPQYRESLHLRYPPVCFECLPAVEDEIQKKNHMARTKALGGWLNESRGKEKQRRVSEVHPGIERISAEVIIWRIRGFLWMATFATATLYNFAAAMGYPVLVYIAPFQPTLPVVTLISLLWTMWDPTYSSVQQAKRQGRDVRVQGKQIYIKLQLVAWSSRLATSTLLALNWYDCTWDWLNLQMPSYLPRKMYFGSLLILELATFTVSCLVIRIHQPPTVRLIETDTHKSLRSSSVRPDRTARSVTPAPRPSSTEPDFMATLSLSSKPIISPVHPVFGLPSLPSSQPSITPVDEDAMDWIPSHTSSHHGQAQKVDNNLWLRPQRFFAPEKPTGLEGLFERALLVNEEPRAEVPPASRTTDSVITKHLSTWWWAYLLSLAPVCGVLYKNWSGTERYMLV